MNKPHALISALLAFCACTAATAASGAPPGERRSVDPGILERPPAGVDPGLIERPPRNVDPGMLERPKPSPGVPGSTTAESRRPKPPPAPPPPVTGNGLDLPSVVVVPRGHTNDKRLGQGCWVQFFDDQAYGGRSLTLVGPVELPKMNIPGGLWVNWSSALVGPSATVTTFDYEQFKNRTAVLRPGQRIPDLGDAKLGLFEDIHSLRIACGAGPKR